MVFNLVTLVFADPNARFGASITRMRFFQTARRAFGQKANRARVYRAPSPRNVSGWRAGGGKRLLAQTSAPRALANRSTIARLFSEMFFGGGRVRVSGGGGWRVPPREKNALRELKLLSAIDRAEISAVSFRLKQVTIAQRISPSVSVLLFCFLAPRCRRFMGNYPINGRLNFFRLLIPRVAVYRSPISSVAVYIVAHPSPSHILPPSVGNGGKGGGEGMG